MLLRPEDLSKEGFEEIDKLDHLNLVPFIQTYLRKPTPASRWFKILNLIFLAVLVALFTFHTRTYDFWTALQFTSYGMLIAFLLVPLHEYIHVLAYKYVGAKETSYDVHLKKFYFMALANRFVTSKQEFQLVALAPFVTVTAVGMTLAFVVNGTWVLTPLATELAHAGFCSGDFGLLSYFDFHKSKEVVTYDDTAERATYFYGRSAGK